jgi:ribosomal protein S18 acetylase RimI-like enzyme
MHFRKGEKKDLNELVNLGYLLAKHEQNSERGIKIKNTPKTKLRSKYSKQISKSNVRFFVAEDKNNIVGFLYGDIEKAPSYLAHKKIAHMSSVFVDPKFRRRGIARKLVKLFMEWLKTNKISFLDAGVLINNTSGLHAWKSLGFKEYYVKLRKDII